VRDVLLDGGHRGVRAAVCERAAGARPVAVLVPVGAVRLEVRQRAAGGGQERVAAMRGPDRGGQPAHGADKWREHRAGAAHGQELSRGRRPGHRVRDGRAPGAVLVLGGG